MPEHTLLERLGNEVRKKHYSGRTEDACADWVARYLRFHGFHDPRNWLDGVVRAKLPKSLPVVLVRDEVAEVLRRL
jgi:hypothetical protein